MSKIGRKPIKLAGVKVDVTGNMISFKGPKSSGAYELPDLLTAQVENDFLTLMPADKREKGKARRDINRIWGLHRALLANKIRGAIKPFEKALQIIGLGYKATLANKKLVLRLGYSHEIDFPLEQGVEVEIDKSGQLLTFKSSDKALVGKVASQVRELRPPEPYKGTGIRFANEKIVRKAGKTKAA